jgi:hypothetical protein
LANGEEGRAEFFVGASLKVMDLRKNSDVFLRWRRWPIKSKLGFLKGFGTGKVT